MWQKVRSIISYIYDHHLDNYDYFHICGDDTYLLVDNLKEFLQEKSLQNYQGQHNGWLYTGFPLYTDDKKLLRRDHDEYKNNFFYMGGGSGYTLSRELIREFVNNPNLLCKCKMTYDGAQEDVMMGLCLRKYLNITIGYDSRDNIIFNPKTNGMTKGSHRYHQLSVDRHANYPAVKKYGYSTQLIRLALAKQEQLLNRSIVYGVDDYISKRSIAFHKFYIPDELRRYEYLLYGSTGGNEQCKNHFNSD